MRKLVGTMLIAAVGLVLGGCETMTRDSDMQIRKYSRIAEINRRLLAEDIDRILLLDKPSSLSRWPIVPEK